jgi:transposase
MPWKECSVMDERLQFVARRRAGEGMAELCRQFGISRKTGYKIFDRYQECGVHRLTDRSRRPYRYAHQLPFQVENYILNVKHEHPSWGPRKIRERLGRRFSDIKIPAKSTIHAVLDRHGLVERRGRFRPLKVAVLHFQCRRQIVNPSFELVGRPGPKPLFAIQCAPALDPIQGFAQLSWSKQLRDNQARGPSQYEIFEMTTNNEDNRARLRRFAHGTLAEFLGYWHEMKLPE